MRSLPTAWVLLLLGLSASLGCRPPAETQTPKNLKEWFQQKERDFRSEDGTIDMESVRDVGQDTIEYQTVNSGTRKTWRQKYRAAGTGSYERVGDPEDITAKAKTDDAKGKAAKGQADVGALPPYVRVYRC
jgi:hypothetical protein